MCLQDVSCVLSTLLPEGFLCLVVTGGNHDQEGQYEAREEKQSGRTWTGAPVLLRVPRSKWGKEPRGSLFVWLPRSGWRVWSVRAVCFLMLIPPALLRTTMYTFSLAIQNTRICSSFYFHLSPTESCLLCQVWGLYKDELLLSSAQLSVQLSLLGHYYFSFKGRRWQREQAGKRIVGQLNALKKIKCRPGESVSLKWTR